MIVNEQSAASRQFVASSPAVSAKWTGTRAYIPLYAAFAVVVLLCAVIAWQPDFAAVAVPVVVGAGLAAVYFFWQSRRKFLITVTSDGLTVDRRRGDVYAFADAQLGPWVMMGVALHQHCGRHRFLLGGRDGRVGPATPLDAPPVRAVDAWLPESEFEELLSLGGRSAARGPAPGEPTRCLLFPNSVLIEQMGSFAFRKKRRLMRSLSKVQLFIDVDNDSIRVIDPNSDALFAMASLSQVTATPATYSPPYRLGLGHGSVAKDVGSTMASNAMNQYFSTTPVMAVRVPGMQPLRIGCRNFTGLKRRFSWCGNVSATNDPPAYEISAADWLTLIEKLGLATYLEDTATAG